MVAITNTTESKDVFSKYAEEGKYTNPLGGGEMTYEKMMRKVEYIFSNYVRGVDAVKYSSRSDFELFRLYAAGKQPEELYHKFFIGTSPTGTRTFDSLGNDVGGVNSDRFNKEDFIRKALGHINWKIMSPMPKIMNKILSSFYGNSYDIHIECVDENSINKQEEAKWTAWVESQNDYQAFMQQISAVAEVPYTPPKQQINSLEELELYEANGGFKLNYAKEGEKVIRDAWNISNEDELDEKIVKDITTLNIAGARVEYDREIGKEVFRWVDPNMAGIQFSKHNDFRDSSYAYEIMLIPAYKLLSYGIDIKRLTAVSQVYAGVYGNPIWSEEYNLNENNENSLRCGFFKVPVLDFEFIHVDEDKKVKYKNRFGQDRVKPYEEGEKLSANKQYMPTATHMVYQGKWVIGTDIMYDWGKKPNQPKREKKQSLLSFHFIRGKADQSLVEQLMPILDAFQHTWLKIQDVKATAVKAGFAYEWESLQGMKLGGGKADPLDILAVHRLTGNSFFTRHSRHSGNVNATPIIPTASNYGQQLQELIADMDFNARMLEDITGINLVSLGATPDPRQGKAVTQLAVSSSGAVVKNIFDKTFLLKANASLDLLMRVQLDLRNSQTVQQRYRAVVGELGVKTLIEAEGMGVKFGTRMVARPSAEDMALIDEILAIAIANSRNGESDFKPNDVLYIKRRMREGANMKEIEQYIGYITEKRNQERQAYAQQTQQLQAQSQQQYAVTQGQVSQQNAQIDTQSKMAIDNNKIEGEAFLKNLEHEHKMKEIEAQTKAKSEEKNNM